MKKSRLPLILSTLAVSALLLYFVQFTDELFPHQPTPAGLPGGNFTLGSTDGAVSLSDFSGKVVVLFFGYSHCPDICPLSLANLTQAFWVLEEVERSSVQGLFVSVDPDRDNPDFLAEYTAYFSPQILGLTGPHEVLDQVTRQYGAFYRQVELRDSALEYAIDHSTRIYLIDKHGQLKQILSHTVSPQVLAEEIRTLL